jgi:hypothetical protein
MVASGYKAITNIDISSIVIQHNIEKYKDTPSLSCKFSTTEIII